MTSPAPPAGKPRRPPRWLAPAALLVSGVLCVLWSTGGGERRRPSSTEQPALEQPAAEQELASIRELAAPHEQATGPDRSQRSAPPPEEGADPGARADRPGVFLRLFEHDGSRPLGDYQVELALFDTQTEGGDPTGRTFLRSDARGWLELTEFLAQHPGDGLLFVHPDYEWRARFDPERLERGALGTTAARATRLRLVRGPMARLAGRALDGRNGQPIPDLALRVEEWSPAADAEPRPWGRHVVSDEETEWMVTDAEGRFRSSTEYPPGRLGLDTLFDEPSLVDLRLDGGEVEARFEIGPVIQLDFTPPGGRSHGDFIAMLYRDPEEAATEEEMSEASSPWSEDGGRSPGRWFNSAPVFAGSPPWTRLPVEERAHPLPSFLVLLSRDGKVKGAARVDDFERHRHLPLHVALEELGSLRGVVRFEGGAILDPQRAAVAGQTCRVDLRGAAGEAVASRWLNGQEDSRPFLFQALRPGSYELQVLADGFLTGSRSVAMPSSAPIDVLLARGGPVVFHEVEGTFLTASGRGCGGGDGGPRLARVGVRSSAPGFFRSAPLSWSDGTGRFSLSLPAGEFQLWVYWERGGFQCEPSDLRFTVPGPGPRILVRDDVPREHFEVVLLDPPEVDVEFEARAALDGSHWSEYANAEVGEASENLPGGKRGLRRRFGPFPEGGAFSVRIRAEGYRSLELGKQDFRLAGDLHSSEVRLRPGWSVRISVQEVSGEECRPLAGIELTLDGLTLPPSDSEGIVRVGLDAKPALLAVRTPGWTLVEHYSWADWGTVFPGGEFTVEEGSLDVFLRR